MAAIALPDPPFAAETEATIRQRMLDAVDASFNKDQGDIVYDLLTPAAMEIAQLYEQLTLMVDNVFASTATSTYLDAIAEEYTGLTRLTAESDADFRTRILARLYAPRGAGNTSDYKTWALEVTGIGYAACEPLWAGAGTVRVLVAQSARTPATAAQVAAVDAYIDTLAPVGATVTVAAVTNTTINVVVNVDPASGFTEDAALTTAITTSLTAYIDTLQPGDDVLFYEIVTAVMNTEGVFNIASITVNATGATVAVAASALAILGTVTVS